MKTFAKALAVVLLWTAPALAQTPTCPSGPPCQGGPLPSPLPLFPATNWWNLDISAAPVDSSSANFITFIGTTKQVHPDFGGVDTGNLIYGIPYVVVNGAQPKKVVTFLYAGESDGVGVPFYPIPDQAITTPRWIEGGEPGNVDQSGDRHLLIADLANNLLYELFDVFYNGTSWVAGSGALFDMKTNNRRPEGWTSADAAGLAILPGLTRYDEAYLGTAPIRHALRMTVRATNGYVYPASHLTCDVNDGDSCPQFALPMGARLRLKPDVPVPSSDVGVQRIVQAMKTYGLIVADNGTDMYFSGTFDERWDNGILNPAFESLDASDFEVIQLGYGSNFADLSITKTDGQTTALPGGTVTYTITATNNGPNAVTGAAVTDVFPAAISSVTWTCSASAGSSCGGGGGTGNISRLVNLLPAGTATFVATATINAAATGTLSNTAAVAIPGGMVDPTAGNNAATDTDTLLLLAPSVTTQAATSVGPNGATLNASVNPNGAATTAVWDYGTTLAYGSTTSGNSLGSGVAPVSTNKAVTGLACSTLYHFRARATSTGGTTNGSDLTFTTSACPPSPREYVSVNGNDGNTCSNPATPCRTFVGAISQVTPGGEIIVLNSGTFGGGTINKSVTINAPAGVAALVATPLVVNAGASDVVTLRGLTFVSPTPGSGTALTFSGGAGLNIENSVIHGWSTGLSFAVAGKLNVSDSVVRDNSVDGIFLSTASGAIQASIERSRLLGNGNGLRVLSRSKAVVKESVVAGNASGLLASSLDSSASELDIEDSSVTHNATTGVTAASFGAVRISGTTVTNNTVGLQQSGSGMMQSRGGNTIEGNGTDTSGTIDTYPGK